MRKCKVKNPKGQGWLEGFIFHAWGYGSEAGANGDPNTMWSIAIVESPEGEIMEYSPDSIWFTDKPPSKNPGGNDADR